MNKFRPWGSLEWTLSLGIQTKWHIVAAIGTEERSLTSWKYLKELNALCGEQIVEIVDAFSEKYHQKTADLMTERREVFQSFGGNSQSIHETNLLAELFTILSIAKKAAENHSVILDITSFPKRFFFPILRRLILDPNVHNLILTYSCPLCYADDAPLYEDIEPWRALPGFGGTSEKDSLWIVSVGFLIESLRQFLGSSPDEKMKVLIPFPSPLRTLRRMWESVASLERGHDEGRLEKYRVETLDISDSFNRICSLSGDSSKIAFAPFGPKTTSVAMCIYSTLRNSSVYYAQPTVYHPEYSKGIRGNSPKSAVNAYWIKHEGENLYSI